MLVAVEVGVALSRPPRLDRLSRVVVDVPFDPVTGSWLAAEADACLTAIGMATGRPGVVMAVSAGVVEIVI